MLHVFHNKDAVCGQWSTYKFNENWDNENWDTTRFHINKGILPGYWKEKQEK